MPCEEEGERIKSCDVDDGKKFMGVGEKDDGVGCCWGGCRRLPDPNEESRLRECVTSPTLFLRIHAPATTTPIFPTKG